MPNSFKQKKTLIFFYLSLSNDSKNSPLQTSRHQISCVQVICVHRQWHMALSNMQAASGHNRFNLLSSASVIMPVPGLWPGIVLFSSKPQQISSDSPGNYTVSNLHVISKILVCRGLSVSNLYINPWTIQTHMYARVIRLSWCPEIKNGTQRDINSRDVVAPHWFTLYLISIKR